MATMKMGKNLQTARTKLLLNQPFFAAMLMSMPVVADRTLWLAATDGRRLLVHPENCERVPVAELQTILCHEVLHVMFQHVPTMIRMKLDREVWNHATDYVINLILTNCRLPMYSGGLLNPQYQGLTAMQVYDRLIQQPKTKRPQSGCGDGQGTGNTPGSSPGDGDESQQNTAPDGAGWDLKVPEHGGDPAEMERDRQTVQQQVAQAASMARMAGKLPGELERFITEMLEPVVPWPHVLQDYMTRVTKDDETWRRRNRRFGAIYLPTRYTEQMGEVVFIGDTSGSISNTELSRMATEVAAIAEQMRPERVRLVWADTKVAGEQVFEIGETPRCEPAGGGGTDMTVPLAHVEVYEPQVVILATDGYTPWPKQPTPYPLIVLCTTNTTVPDWAQVIRV